MMGTEESPDCPYLRRVLQIRLDTSSCLPDLAFGCGADPGELVSAVLSFCGNRFRGLDALARMARLVSS